MRASPGRIWKEEVATAKLLRLLAAASLTWPKSRGKEVFEDALACNSPAQEFATGGKKSGSQLPPSLLWLETPVYF